MIVSSHDDEVILPIASAERSKVTLPVKILHLIVSDLQSHLEATAASEEEEEDGSEEGEGVREMEALLRSEEGQWEESEDDHDFCKDPLLQLDMQASQSLTTATLTVCVYVCVDRLI